MSQNYKFKSLEYANGDKSNQKQEAANGLTVFETGETKTIDFIKNDGTRQSFPYSHFLTVWYGEENKERFIKIFFATHLITVKGYCLDEIYENLRQFNLKTLKANNERYTNDPPDDEPFVTTILIEWKNTND